MANVLLGESVAAPHHVLKHPNAAAAANVVVDGIMSGHTLLL